MPDVAVLPLLRLGRLELAPGLRAFQPGAAAADLVATATVQVPESPSEQQHAWDVAWSDAVREAGKLGADQRTAIANDSPNHINFVVRRSEDDGRTWGPLQLVVRSAGSGAAGASVIDSCLVVDEEADRVLAVIDHFPGGVGQPNNEAGTGMTAAGELLLHDSSGARHVRRPDGSVTTADGEPTAYHVDAAGAVTLDGRPPQRLRVGECPQCHGAGHVRIDCDEDEVDDVVRGLPPTRRQVAVRRMVAGVGMCADCFGVGSVAHVECDADRSPVAYGEVPCPKCRPSG